MSFPKCACGCGVVLERRGKRGPAPQYATALCRKRAERRRTRDANAAANDWTADVLPDRVRPVVQLPVSGSADQQVQRAILELRACAFALMRLGVEARPELGWRCTTLGQRVMKDLQETFGKEIAE